MSTEVLSHWVAYRDRDGNPHVLGPFRSEAAALVRWVFVASIDAATARVVCAKDEKEAEEWL